jgi:hypothetical protein
MKYVIAILLLVSVSGCVGITGGRISGRKHGFEVSKQLKPGMSFQEVQTILADGGAPYPPEVTFVRNAEGVFAPADPNKRGRFDMVMNQMTKLKEADQKRVLQAVIQSRGWGLFGFDEFCLFFDKEDKLVGHAMHHFN